MANTVQKAADDATELQHKLIALAEEYSKKIPADMIALAMASVTGKILEHGTLNIKKARLKTLIKQQLGMM